jgi:hypothetical protein
MYRRFNVIPQVFFVPLSFFSFWQFLESFLVIFVVRFLRSFFAGFVVQITHGGMVPLFLVILSLQIRGNAFDLVVFGGVLGVVFLEVDFQFLLIL